MAFYFCIPRYRLNYNNAFATILYGVYEWKRERMRATRRRDAHGAQLADLVWLSSEAHTHLCLSLLNFVFFYLLFILVNKLFFYLNKCVLSLILGNSEKLLNIIFFNSIAETSKIGYLTAGCMECIVFFVIQFREFQLSFSAVAQKLAFSVQKIVYLAWP